MRLLCFAVSGALLGYSFAGGGGGEGGWAEGAGWALWVAAILYRRSRRG